MLLLFQLEYFFIIKTSNLIGLDYEVEYYFDSDDIFTNLED